MIQDTLDVWFAYRHFTLSVSGCPFRLPARRQYASVLVCIHTVG